MQKISCVVLVIILLSTMFFTGDMANGENTESPSRSAEQYNDGYRYNIQGWIYLHIEGEPYERGYQHGYLLADEIIDMIERWNSVFPQKWSWKLQKQSAMRLFWRKYPEEYKQEIMGIADGVAAKGSKIDGSEIDYKDILTLNEMYESLSRFRRYSVYPFRVRDSWWASRIFSLIPSGSSSSELHTGKCSAFLATGDTTADGGIVAAHSTFGGAPFEGYWWSNYIAGRWNVLLDIKPTNGHRMLISTSPGLIWSDEDFYQNDAGMILMETTLDPLGAWSRFGDPVVVRARKAIQYSDSIDEMVNCFLKNNNGLMTNDWLMGDTKTGEIASLELALHHYGLTRTKNGFIWSCNNAKDNKVRWELNSLFGLGLLGRVVARNFKSTPRDIMFEQLRDEYYGKIDINVAKKIMSTYPICSVATDCKITSSQLINNFGLWAFMGKPDGTDFIADDHPFAKPKPGYTDMPACGWVQLYALSSPNSYQSTNQKVGHATKQTTLRWEYETKEEILANAVYSSPTTKDDMIYVSSWNGDVTAIHAPSGSQQWETNIGWSSASSPTIAGNILFVGSSDGLYALNKKTGSISWKKEIGAVSSKPAISDGIVYCGSHGGKVYALNAENGKVKWIYETDGSIYSSPILDKNVVYIGSNDGQLYAFDADTGNIIWSYQTDNAICSSPLLHDDVVYVGSWDNNLYALDSKTGELEWTFTTGWGIDASPTTWDNTIYIGSMDNNFYALNAEDGTIKWTFTTDAAIHSSPTIYGGFVFFGCDDGTLYALNASTGELEWSVAPDYHIEGIYNYVTKPLVSSPIIYDGKVFIGSTNGNVYSFDAGTFESPEPLLQEIKIPIDTLIFMTIPLLCIILATALYLYREKKRG